MGYHLWREYPTAPFQRYAATLRAAATPDGFEIADHDPAVADAVFLARVAERFRRPVLVGSAVEDSTGMILEQRVLTQPGEPGYFEEAVRTVPGATLRSVGRE